MQTEKSDVVWSVLRMLLGLVFLWAFFDKFLGLGFNTCIDVKTGMYLGFKCPASWLAGGSPTYGYLQFATKGPFVEFFKSLSQYWWIDWTYMFGLLGIGVGLTFGIFTRFSAFCGILMMTLFYVSGFIWPEHHPFIDEHIINIAVLLGILFSAKNQIYSVDNWWSERSDSIN